MAWWFPGTLLGAALGGVGALAQIRLLRTGASYRTLLLGALLGHCVGFYWLAGAIEGYSGLGLLPSLAIFGALMLVGAIQFPLLAWLYRHLPQRGALGMALANLVVECLGLRILPWLFGHTQLPLPWAQVADLGGALLVSFLLMWTAESLYRTVVERQPQPLGLLAALAACLYGLTRPTLPAPTVPVTLVQGNHADLARYTELSRGREGLVLWPESAVLEPISDEIRQRSEEPRLPAQTLLFGAYTWDEGHHLYNAALAVLPDGSLPAPYHKQVLLPWAETSWLAKVRLSPGTAPGVFAYPGLKVGPLICYEDVLAGPPRQAVRAGAEVLANLANDSWFGPLGAAQHHQLASFRAVEYRRYLLRVTNSGLTAVVDPQGRTVAQAPQGVEAVLEARVEPRTGLTPYGRWGDGPLRCLGLLAFLGALKGVWRRGAKSPE